MRLITAGATSQSVYFDVLDSTSTTGGRKTGLAFGTTGIQAWYTRNGATAVQIGTTGALVTQTAAGAWTSAGFAEVSASNAPGQYRLDVPNAAFAGGVPSVVITLFGAAGMVQSSYDVQLTVPDLQSALATPTNITAGVITTTTNLTNLPNIPNDWLTAAGIAASALNGKGDWLLATSYIVQTGDSFARLGAPAGASVSADIAAVKSDTGTILTDVNTGAGAIYTRIGAPAGASIAADIAAVEANAVAIKAKTDALSIDGSGNVSITSNIKKNSARAGFMLVMTDSTNHVPTAGLTVSATRSIDGAAFAGTTNSVTGVANGTYTIDLSAADVNGNHIMLRFTATGADDLNIEIVTQP